MNRGLINSIVAVFSLALLLPGNAGAEPTKPDRIVVSSSQLVSSITVSLTKEAQQKQDGNEVKINPDELAATVRKTFEEESLMQTSPEKQGLTMEIQIKDLRVRSLAATAVGGAFLMGFGTGFDNLTADIIVKDADGTVRGTYEASGNGVAGGVMTEKWKLEQLYSGFSKQAMYATAGNRPVQSP